MSPNTVLTPFSVSKHSPHSVFCLKNSPHSIFCLTTKSLLHFLSQNIAFTPFCNTVPRQHSWHVLTASNHRVSVFLILYISDLHGTAYNTLPDDTQENRIKQCINYLPNVLYRDTCSTDSLVTIGDRNPQEFLMT
jgi:hypothetical protein